MPAAAKMTLVRLRQFEKDYRAWLREYVKLWDKMIAFPDWTSNDNTYDDISIDQALKEIRSLFIRLQRHRAFAEKVLMKKAQKAQKVLMKKAQKAQK